MKDAQKSATMVFISASVLFGVVGVVLIMMTPQDSEPPELLFKLLFSLGFIILSSFGVSVGLKYLSSK
jgi:hypothetical protein